MNTTTTNKRSTYTWNDEVMRLAKIVGDDIRAREEENSKSKK